MADKTEDITMTQTNSDEMLDQTFTDDVDATEEVTTQDVNTVEPKLMAKNEKASKPKNTKLMIGAGVGVLALGAVGYLFLGGGSSQQPQVVEQTEAPVEQPVQQPEQQAQQPQQEANVGQSNLADGQNPLAGATVNEQIASQDVLQQQGQQPQQPVVEPQVNNEAFGNQDFFANQQPAVEPPQMPEQTLAPQIQAPQAQPQPQPFDMTHEINQAQVGGIQAPEAQPLQPTMQQPVAQNVAQPTQEIQQPPSIMGNEGGIQQPVGTFDVGAYQQNYQPTPVNNNDQMKLVADLQEMFKSQSEEIKQALTQVTDKVDVVTTQFGSFASSQAYINDNFEQRITKLEGGFNDAIKIVAEQKQKEEEEKQKAEEAKKAKATKKVVKSSKTKSSVKSSSKSSRYSSNVIVDNRDDDRRTSKTIIRGNDRKLDREVPRRRAQSASIEIHSIYGDRVWLRNSDGTLTTYTKGDRLPNGEIISAVEPNRIITRSGREVY